MYLHAFEGVRNLFVVRTLYPKAYQFPVHRTQLPLRKLKIGGEVDRLKRDI